MNIVGNYEYSDTIPTYGLYEKMTKNDYNYIKSLNMWLLFSLFVPEMTQNVQNVHKCPVLVEGGWVSIL
eukprot:Pgem_evm1s17545